MQISRILVSAALAAAVCLVTRASASGADAPASRPASFAISTPGSELLLYVGPDGRLYEASFGTPGAKFQQAKGGPGRIEEFYPPSGDGYINQPAIQATHADGNTSTDLRYLRHESKAVTPGVTLTRIELKDSYYPFYVTLCFKAYADSNVVEEWSEIRHDEPAPVTLLSYASASPVLKAKEYWLTQFCGEYSREARISEEKLAPGIKVIDSKIGTRASQFVMPSAIVSLDGPADEETGKAAGCSLEWSGSYQLAFEVDPGNHLRVLSGINPFGEAYHLDKGRTFVTPAVLWTYSDQGKGQVSRNFHRWARAHGLRDGSKERPVLLNNWEATYFNFDEKKIVSLFDGAKELGAELFLLDDGWFGNAHPRNDDRAGLGDWQVNTKKLPHGLSYLALEAKKRGIRFGIWIEPEMVNPKSDLFDKHPDWAIQQPHRELQLQRNQLVLDLTRPAVKDVAWNCIDQTLSTPGVAYVKWDCNRYVTQPGSTYLPADRQSHLMVDYNFALYDLMDRMVAKFPNVMAMGCSGGGGRADYGAIRHFHTFWPSDNTDPRSRVFIQWGYGHIFPAEAMSNHVTRMNKRPLKFCCDVAMSGSLGLDLDVSKLSADERKFLASAVKTYKSEVRPVVMSADLYRLESPYDHPRAALNFVSPDKSRAIVFVYQLKDSASDPVHPRGLDPQRKYRVTELDLPVNTTSSLSLNGRTVYGETLMRDGLIPTSAKPDDSNVILLEAVAGE